jgi:hypothetical protein
MTNITATLAAFMLVSLAANALLYRDFKETVQAQLDQINKTLISHDGRRNAQYGILKREVKRCER